MTSTKKRCCVLVQFQTTQPALKTLSEEQLAGYIDGALSSWTRLRRRRS